MAIRHSPFDGFQPLQSPRSPGRRSLLDLQSLPPVLRPVLRAYLLGYASVVLPRLVALLLRHLCPGSRTNSRERPPASSLPFLKAVPRILLHQLELRRFPAFCALLVGGSGLLQEPFRKILARLSVGLGERTSTRIASWFATFVAACLALRLLQTKPQSSCRDESSGRSREAQREPEEVLAGRTLDLTLFAATQAVDVIVGEVWSRHRARRTAAQSWTKAEEFISRMTDPLVFAASSGLIMWSWFYAPDRLPRTYNKWITSAAHVDQRLLQALRRFHRGELRYGEETGQAPLLASLCRDLGLPCEWGDPVKSAPFPCELVHTGRGPSCEKHALARFCSSWRWSMLTYLPLALVVQLRRPRRGRLTRALASASRSSAFLATFIALFYYGVCLSRTRLGPRLVGQDISSCQRLDGGLCVAAGCALCGWSVLIETASRRKDMALFVAPRALATLLPRRYPKAKQGRETLVFAASAAVVFTCALENPKRVRGMLGGLLRLTMRP